MQNGIQSLSQVFWKYSVTKKSSVVFVSPLFLRTQTAGLFSWLTEKKWKDEFYFGLGKRTAVGNTGSQEGHVAVSSEVVLQQYWREEQGKENAVTPVTVNKTEYVNQ